MIYLDNAATTYPKPPAALAAVEYALRECGGNPGRSSHALSLRASEEIDGVRAALAALLEVPDPDHIVFTLNATHALNLAIRTHVRRGTHILISDREHNAVYRPVCRLCREGVADFDVFSTHGSVRRNILSLLRPETDMLICNHVSNVDGAVAPVEEIGRVCRERGIYFILDASQSMGHMPVHPAEIGADAVCAPGHKGLFGIPGAGFAWLKSGAGLSSFMDGGSGSHSLSPEMPPDLPERMEAGTLPTPAILSMGAGIRYIQGLSLAAIAEKENALLCRLRDRLQGMRGVHIFAAPHGSVLSFVCGDMPPDLLTACLDERGICVRSGLHCAPLAHAALGTQRSGTVRVSFSCMNTMQEVDVLATALQEILSDAG